MKITALIAISIPLSIFAGVNGVELDVGVDRVKTPLEVDMSRLGTLLPRPVGEIAGDTNWRLGCEVLDRDYVDFNEYKELVAPLGIGKVRLQGGWAKCERVKGVYDFAWLDSIVDYLRSQGVECAIETSYGNRIYEGGGGPDLAGGFPCGEEALAGWDAWVDALTKHFAGRVKTWLMWNEPDIGQPEKTPEMIAAFNIRTARIVRRNIPGAEIAGLSLAHNSADFFERCLVDLGEDVRLFDYFIYHGYTPAPESAYAQVEIMKSLVRKYAPHARLWQGENGAPSEMTRRFALSWISWSEYSQAKWNMRRMLGDLGHDVISSVYTICDFKHSGVEEDRGMNNKGLLRANEDKEVIGVKRAYYAVQNVVSLFDASVVRVGESKYGSGFGSTDGSLSTYHYRNGAGDSILVFWTHGTDYHRAKKGGEDGVLGEGDWALVYERPGDGFETRPAAFRLTGEKPFSDPVWIDLLTGRVYEFPKSHQVASKSGIWFFDVPVYDSPCVLTERRAVRMQGVDGECAR